MDNPSWTPRRRDLLTVLNAECWIGLRQDNVERVRAAKKALREDGMPYLELEHYIDELEKTYTHAHQD